MTYTVHREAEPYFTPAPDNQKESLGMPFADTIIYDDPDDLTGLGNQFYAVVGKNAAGAGGACPPGGDLQLRLAARRMIDLRSRSAVTIRARAASTHFESLTRDEFAYRRQHEARCLSLMIFVILALALTACTAPARAAPAPAPAPTSQVDMPNSVPTWM